MLYNLIVERWQRLLQPRKAFIICASFVPALVRFGCSAIASHERCDQSIFYVYPCIQFARLLLFDQQSLRSLLTNKKTLHPNTPSRLPSTNASLQVSVKLWTNLCVHVCKCIKVTDMVYIRSSSLNSFVRRTISCT